MDSIKSSPLAIQNTATRFGSLVRGYRDQRGRRIG